MWLERLREEGREVTASGCEGPQDRRMDLGGGWNVLSG